MNEQLSSKIKSSLEQAGIIIDTDLEVFLKKSMHQYIKMFKDLRKLGHSINNLSALKTFWKCNIVFSRFIFKYALFTENYLLAIIENCIALDKTKVRDLLNQTITKNNSNDKTETIKNVIKLLDKNKASLDKLKFSEKITIYKIVKNKFSGLDHLQGISFDKIRTIRNRAVHSDFILDYFWKDSTKDNLQSLYNVVDESYQAQFKEEFENIISKYSLQEKFVWNTF